MTYLEIGIRLSTSNNAGISKICAEKQMALHSFNLVLAWISMGGGQACIASGPGAAPRVGLWGGQDRYIGGTASP